MGGQADLRSRLLCAGMGLVYAKKGGNRGVGSCRRAMMELRQRGKMKRREKTRKGEVKDLKDELERKLLYKTPEREVVSSENWLLSM